MSFATIALLSILSVTKALYNCATPTDFDASNPVLKTQILKKIKSEKSQGKLLHELMFDKAKKINPAIFPDAKRLTLNKKKILIRKKTHIDDNEIPCVRREIEISKMMCGMKKEETSNPISNCKSKAIQSFYGCVQDGRTLYVFQEDITKRLTAHKFFILWVKSTGRQKSDLMIQIASKFEELHKIKIVHGNIQRANLFVNGNNFDDIRIGNLESANEEGQQSFRLNPFYVPPEHLESKVLSYAGDVYALAVTFSMMEISMLEYSIKIDDGRAIATPLSDDELKNFRAAVASSFNKENNTGHLAEVIAKAISEDPSERFKTMKDFREAIVAASSKLKKARRILASDPPARTAI